MGLPQLLNLPGDPCRELHHGPNNGGAGEEQQKSDVLTHRAEEATYVWSDEECGDVEQNRSRDGPADRSEATDNGNSQDSDRDVRPEERR